MSSLGNFAKKYAGTYFESSCFETPQFKAFAASFKRALKKDAKESAFEVVDFSKGHFELDGFLRHKETRRYVYFSIDDVRFFKDEWKDKVLYRLAKDEKDFTGEWRHYAPLMELLKAADELVWRDRHRKEATA